MVVEAVTLEQVPLSNGNTKLYQKFGDTYYTDGMIMADGTHDNRSTSPDVIHILESLRRSGRVCRIFYGSEDGRSWMDENFIAGVIGRSCGRIKIPILCAPEDIGGGALLDACIIRIDVAPRRTLWKHPKFHVPEMKLIVGDLLDLPYEVWWNNSVQARFFSPKEAERYMGILRGDIFPNTKQDPGAFGIMDDEDTE